MGITGAFVGLKLNKTKSRETGNENVRLLGNISYHSHTQNVSHRYHNLHFVSDFWKVHLLAEMSVELDYLWALEMETWKALL